MPSKFDRTNLIDGGFGAAGMPRQSRTSDKRFQEAMATLPDASSLKSRPSTREFITTPGRIAVTLPEPCQRKRFNCRGNRSESADPMGPATTLFLNS